MYWKRIAKAWKSMRTWAMTVMTAFMVIPDKLEALAEWIFSPEWVEANWKGIVMVVGIVMWFIHNHGSARDGSDVPLEER